MMQYSVHPPSEFICQHCKKLLPQWSSPVRSVLIVLQPASVQLTEQTLETELQKYFLRSRFLDFGLKIADDLRRIGHDADLFDPRTGFPILSQSGVLPLDDVAVVRSSLGYSTLQIGDCFTIVHPDWGSAVYPSILMSSADRACIESIVNGVEGLLECHHSLSG